MKVLHLNTHSTGGAANGAYRIHTALLASGINSIFSTRTDIDKYNHRYILKRIERGLCAKILDKLIYSTNSFTTICGISSNIYNFIKNINPDIINFHWVADNFISFSDAVSISRLNIPIVWTIRDTWPFTGGCHFFSECANWQKSCIQCSLYKYNSIINISKHQFKYKSNIYKKINPTLITLSSQFSEYINKSPLLSNYQYRKISNTININIFKPIDKIIAKKILNIDDNKKYILFGACSAISDKRKGHDLLSSALNSFHKNYNNNIECLIFGAFHGNSSPELPFPTHYLGQLHDEVTLALIYSAADVFVCPSREESFSNTTLESLSCGTPVVGFSVGGIPDMIEHGVNGMLATPHDPAELAAGIEYILADDERRQRMGEAARRVAVERYSMPVVAKQYIELYQKILDDKKSGKH